MPFHIVISAVFLAALTFASVSCTDIEPPPARTSAPSATLAPTSTPTQTSVPTRMPAAVTGSAPTPSPIPTPTPASTQTASPTPAPISAASQFSAPARTPAKTSRSTPVSASATVRLPKPVPTHAPTQTPIPTAAPKQTPLPTPTPASATVSAPTPVPIPTSTPISTQTAAPTSAPKYLTQEIPPCTPVEGSPIDPCEPDVGRVTDSYVSEEFGTEPFSMRFFLDGERGSILNAHLVVRGTYLPGTVRCIVDNDFRSPSFVNLGNKSLSTGVDSVNCFADVRVNSYILGSGPPYLTVLVKKLQYWMNAEQEVADQLVSGLDRAFNEGGYHPRIDVPAGGIAGREAILFIGPEVDVTTEAWAVFETWDVQQQKDGTVIAVHPERDIWRDYHTEEYEAYRSRLEMDLPTFAQSVTTANQSRLAEYGGRIGADANRPMVVTNANRLRQYFSDPKVGAYAPDAPAPAQPPPPCGFAVPDQANNPGLMRDCITLLGLKDALRGTATLNWSVDTPISDWDGVRVLGSPGRVTSLVLTSNSLTGTVPAELARLDGLEHLKLNYNQLTGEIPAALGNLSNLEDLLLGDNQLTGCIPPALRNVDDNDLHRVGLQDCATP